MKSIKFVVYGNAVPKARPKLVMNKYTHRAHLYTAQTTRNWEQCIIGQALNHKPLELIKGPVKLCIKVYKGIPKSFSKKKKELALKNEIRPTGRPDLSNYIKSCEDALNGLFWSDDGIVVEYLEGTGKFYSETPRVEMEIQFDFE